MKKKRRPSDLHRHQHVDIRQTFLGLRPHQDGAVLVLELEQDLLGADGREEIQQVLGVEPDLQVLTLVLDGQAVARLADLRVRGEEPQLVLLDRELDPLGPFGRQERDPPDGVGQLRPPDDEPSRVVFGYDRLVIGEFAFDDPGDERPRPCLLYTSDAADE